MTVVSPSPLPYAAWPTTAETPVVETFLGESAVRYLDDAEFELLLRAVDAVVLSHAFSRPTLKYALNLTDQETDLMTAVLEALGLIRPGGRDERRDVAAEVSHLPLLVTRLTGVRAGR